MVRTPPAGRASDFAKRDRLCAFPERPAAELLELLLPLDERREMVRPQVSRLRCEGAVPVGKEELRFALTARVEGEFAVAPGNPVRLAAPAAVDDAVVEGEDPSERSHGLGRELLFEAREEAQVGGRDLQHAHGILAPWANQRPRRSRSALVIPVTFPSGIA